MSDDDELDRSLGKELKSVGLATLICVGGSQLAMPGIGGLVAGGLLSFSYAAFRLYLRTGRALQLGAWNVKHRLGKVRFQQAARAALMLPEFPSEARVIDSPEGGARLEARLPLSGRKNAQLSVIFGATVGEGTVLYGDYDVAFAVLEANLHSVAAEGDLARIKNGFITLESAAIVGPEDLLKRAQRFVALAARLDDDFGDGPTALLRAVKDAFEPKGRVEALRRLLRFFAELPEARQAAEIAAEGANAELRLIALFALGHEGQAGLAELVLSEVELWIRLEALDRLHLTMIEADFTAVLDRALEKDLPAPLRMKVAGYLGDLRPGEGGRLSLIGGDERGQLSLNAGEQGALSEPQKE
jgi:hypothetical protein